MVTVTLVSSHQQRSFLDHGGQCLWRTGFGVVTGQEGVGTSTSPEWPLARVQQGVRCSASPGPPTQVLLLSGLWGSG